MNRLDGLVLTALLAAAQPGLAQSRGVCEVNSHQMIPLFSLFSNARGDNLATTDPAWRGSRFGEVKGAPDYTYYREEGSVLHPSAALEGTAPLFLWWSPSRQDNFASTHPLWTNNTALHSPDYQFVGVLGRVFSPERPQPPGTIPVFSLYSESRGDNILTSDPQWRASRDGYHYLRIEGYICGAPGAKRFSRSIPGHYLICNLLQMETVRQPVWGGVLALYGATPAEVSQYGSFLSQAAQCACRNDNAELATVVSKWRGLLGSIDARLAQALGIDLREAAQLREAGIGGERENFRNQCIEPAGGDPGLVGVADALLALSQFPQTPSLGIGAPVASDAALGRCRSDSRGRGYSPINARAGLTAGNPASFLSCLEGNYPLPFRRDCGDPAAQVAEGATPRTPPETKGGRDSKGGGSGTEAVVEVTGAGAEAAAVASQAPELQRAAVAAAIVQTQSSAPASSLEQLVHQVARVVVGGGVHLSGRNIGADLTVRAAPGLEVGVEVSNRGGSVNITFGLPGRDRIGGSISVTDERVYIGFHGNFDCANVNPASNPAMGFRRSTSSISAGYMTNADRALECMCKSSNPALSGFASKALEGMGVEMGCGSLRLRERSDCMRPKGLRGQVILPDPQCAEYARQDNTPKVSPEEFCKKVILCPNGLTGAISSPAGGFTCGCAGNSIQPQTGIAVPTQRDVSCALVSCQPGDTHACCSQSGRGISSGPRSPGGVPGGGLQPSNPPLPANLPRPKQ